MDSEVCGRQKCRLTSALQTTARSRSGSMLSVSVAPCLSASVRPLRVSHETTIHITTCTGDVSYRSGCRHYHPNLWHRRDVTGPRVSSVLPSLDWGRRFYCGLSLGQRVV